MDVMELFLFGFVAFMAIVVLVSVLAAPVPSFSKEERDEIDRATGKLPDLADWIEDQECDCPLPDAIEVVALPDPEPLPVLLASSLHTALTAMRAWVTLDEDGDDPLSAQCRKAIENIEAVLRATSAAGERESGPVPPQAGHPEYLKLLDEMRDLHQKKAADYGRGSDPFANVRASAEFGMPAWIGVMVRAGDKFHRIKSFIANGSLKNESVEDSLKDLAAYALIGLVLYRETVNWGGNDFDHPEESLPIAQEVLA